MTNKPAITDDWDPTTGKDPHPGLPWFVNRLMGDEWSFGLRLTDGTLLGVTHLDAIRFLDGEAWLDVSLMAEPQGFVPGVAVAPTSRLTASVNARHIMYVIELADT